MSMVNISWTALVTIMIHYVELSLAFHTFLFRIRKKTVIPHTALFLTITNHGREINSTHKTGSKLFIDSILIFK